MTNEWATAPSFSFSSPKQGKGNGKCNGQVRQRVVSTASHLKNSV